jgi:hypothetical protein
VSGGETRRPPGRPRAELTDERRAELEHARRALEAAELELERARGVFEQAVTAARGDGASFRAIGDAVGRAPSSLHELVGGGD